MRTIVYIDGYNLYYGLLKGSKYKWLDLFALFRDHVLDKNADLTEVRYYTAPVLGRMSDNAESPTRQRQYLQALREMYPDQITIIEGKIIASKPFQRLVTPIDEAPHLQKVQVFNFTEKKTDVNLATDLLTDAWTKRYEQAVVCSNDTDLEAALFAIRKHHPSIRLGLVAPIPSKDHRHISKDLSNHAHWAKVLSPVHLSNAQLPERIPSSKLRKPENW